MNTASSYRVLPGWRIVLRDMGLNPRDVLRRADLPEDLFARESTWLSTEEYFRLWHAMEEEAASDVPVPLQIGRALSVEAFDPTLFAATCSPNIAVAARRIGQFKRLLAPMTVDVIETDESATIVVDWIDSSVEPPAVLVATDLVFFVQLTRLLTRCEVRPIAITTPQPPQPADAYTEYFGVEVAADDRHAIGFSALDARRQFLTANERMWEFFEPELRKRLSEIDASASMAERVRSALLELLPSGNASAEEIARRLGVSKRTLQRRLSDEAETLQSVMTATRQDLAHHYLERSQMSGAEISFLLGYEDPNSFFRAFRTWTGETPEAARARLRGAMG